MRYLLLLRGAMGAGKTKAAEQIRSQRSDVKVIEVDDIKRERYGSSARCRAEEDFPEAGRRAKRALDAGCHAIVVEPLCEVQHIKWVVQEARVEMTSEALRSIWLHCSEETALQRKQKEHPRKVIREQHQRYRDRHRLEGEAIISTDAAEVAEVVGRILELLPADG